MQKKAFFMAMECKVQEESERERRNKERTSLLFSTLINSMSHFVIYLRMNYAFCNFLSFSLSTTRRQGDERKQ